METSSVYNNFHRFSSNQNQNNRIRPNLFLRIINYFVYFKFLELFFETLEDAFLKTNGLC